MVICNELREGTKQILGKNSSPWDMDWYCLGVHDQCEDYSKKSMERGVLTGKLKLLREFLSIQEFPIQ